MNARLATSAQAAPAGQAAVTAATRCFDIEFVPTEASASGDGIVNLLDELRGLGQLDILQQPDDGPHAVGFWQLRLSTAHPQTQFSEQIDFIAESGAWRIVENRAIAADGSASYGFFDDVPGLPDEERAYGFFEPLPAVPAQDESYGFFEPLPEVPAAASTGPADESCGFLAPAPAASAAGDGEAYGFFEPLPAASVAQPAGVAATGQR